MRITKEMLEEQNTFLRSSIEEYAKKQVLLEKEIKLLGGIVDTYSRMPSLLIATERITQALTETIIQVKRR